MDLSKTDFQVLEVLDSQEITTQRQLSERAGISLGQVNYVLKSLLERGLVKIGNFRKSTHKIGYVYLLTPKGIEAKSRLAARFVVAKLKEYHQLRQTLAQKLVGIEAKGHCRVMFVGPEIVKDFVDSIITEQKLKLQLVGDCRRCAELKAHKADSFDIALLFDGQANGLKGITAATGLPSQKLLPLW